MEKDLWPYHSAYSELERIPRNREEEVLGKTFYPPIPLYLLYAIQRE